jgi:nucleolar protein 9
MFPIHAGYLSHVLIYVCRVSEYVIAPVKCARTMVCFGSKAIRPKGDRQSDLLDGGLDDGSQKKRGRNDKEEKRRKGGSGSSRKPSAEKPKHSQRKQKGDDQRKGKGRGEERRLESSRSVNNRNVLPSSDASKSVQNVLRYGCLFSIS